MASLKFDRMIKQIALIGICLVLSGTNPLRAQSNSTKMPVNVMSFNIHAGYGTDGTFDLVKIGNQIREAQSDIVCLQEVDRRTRRSKGKDVTLELANFTGFHSFFGKAISHDGGDYGLGILSKYPILDAKVHSLPGDGIAESRIALEVMVQIQGTYKIRIVNAHLDHSNKELNRSQTRYLDKKFRDGFPTILAGDFNQTMDDKGMQRLRKVWNLSMTDDAFTYPSNNPNIKIDYLMAHPRNKWKVEKAQVLKDSKASDHLPIIATFSLL